VGCNQTDKKKIKLHQTLNPSTTYYIKFDHHWTGINFQSFVILE